MCLARRFPAAAAAHALLPSLRHYAARAGPSFSSVLVGADLAIHVCRRGSGASPPPPPLFPLSLRSRLLRVLLPWVTAPVALTRVLAQVALQRCLPSLKQRGGAPSSSPLRWLQPLFNMVKACPDIAEQTKKAEKHMSRVAPSAAASLAALLCSPCSEHGELLPRDTFSYVAGVMAHLSAARHKREVGGALGGGGG